MKANSSHLQGLRSKVEEAAKKRIVPSAWLPTRLAKLT
jgi:hypothetical protein